MHSAVYYTSDSVMNIIKQLNIGFVLLAVAVFCQAEIRIKGSLNRILDVERGKKYEMTIEIVNPDETQTQVQIKKADYDQTIRGEKILAPNSHTMSNSSWIDIEHERFLVPTNSKASVKVFISVPETTEPTGTYYSLLLIRELRPAVTVAKGEKGLAIFTQWGVFVITNVEAGMKEVEVEEVSYDDETEKLSVDIENIGTQALILQVEPELKELKKKRLRIFPGCARRVVFNCSSLERGSTYRFRVFLDDGDTLVLPFWVEFNRPIPEEELLVVGEEIRKTERPKRRPFRLSASLDYGNKRKGVRLLSSLRTGNFSFSTSIMRNEFADYFYDGYMISSNYHYKNFRASLGTYRYNDSWWSMLRSNIYFKGTSINISYIFERKVMNLSVSRKILSRYILRLFAVTSPDLTTYTFSLLIPII